MSVSDEEIGQWLDQEEPKKQPSVTATDNEIEAFLDDKPVQKDTPVKEKDEWTKPISDIGAGATDSFLNLLDIPNSVYNWGAEKLGLDYRFPSTRDLGSELGIGYKEGEEPDTGSYEAGEYIGMGLEFLAPILKVGSSMRTGVNLASKANPSVARGVAETMTKPFAQSPKLALGAEVTASTASGYGAHYGREEYGWKGEQIGGLFGAGLPALGTLGWKSSSNYIAKSFFPMSEKGSRAKAGDAIRLLRGTPEVVDEIAKQKKLAIEGTTHTSARLSKEPYLIALEKALIHDDPEFTHKLKIIDAENNAIAKADLRQLGGDGQIEDAMKSLGSRYAKLKIRLDTKVDSALNKAKVAATKVSPKNQRKYINMEVKKQIDNSLKAARESENAIWNEVDKTAIAPTEQTRSTFESILKSRELEADPADIPSFLYKFLGKLDKTGSLKGGKYKGGTRHVGGIQALRSRLLQTIRTEKAGDTPNWNKVRILEDIEESMLNDMANSSAAKGLDDALNFSRELNAKFKGDIMSVILRNSKTGGTLAPELTLESLGAGPKGAYHIKRILDASPESKGSIEDVLKVDIIQQKIVKDGVLNIEKAKDYLRRNEQIMDIFPGLKDDMERAVSLSEAHKYFDGSAKARIKKAESALGFSLSDKTNPGRFITKILSSKEPDKTMARVLRQVNDDGKAGIKKDVVDIILDKSKVTSELVGEEQTFKLSGTKALGYWNENKNVLSKAFSKKEQKRLERVFNTLRLGDDPKDIPVDVAKEALSPKKTMLGYVVEVVAARTGAMLGSGTSGASLKTASQAANTARALMAKFDSGTAKKLLKDAILDDELFTELSKDISSFDGDKAAFNVVQGWMVAHAINSLEHNEDIED